MTLDEYNQFCASLPATSHVVQWGGSHVWKVGGKLFAVGSNWDGPKNEPDVTFKVTEMSFDMLKDQPGCRPAPYLASRGMKWIQRQTSETLDDGALKAYLTQSHSLVAAKLTKAQRKAFNL